MGLSAIVGQRGKVTFSVSNGNMATLGLRFNGSAFTSIPAVGRQRLTNLIEDVFDGGVQLSRSVLEERG